MREACLDRYSQYPHELGVWSPICSKKLEGIVKLASALEYGRYIARDIGKSPRTIPSEYTRLILSSERRKFPLREKEDDRREAGFPSRVSAFSWQEISFRRGKSPAATDLSEKGLLTPG